jgi:hypothetical protein
MGEEPVETTLGLASPSESRGGANERRKPDRRRQSRETGGGFPLGSLRSGLAGASVDGRRFGPTKSHRLTAVRGKRSSVPRKARASARVERGATGSVRGSFRRPRARPTTPARGGSATSGARCRARQKWREGQREREGRGWARDVKRVPTRGRIAETRSGAIGFAFVIGTSGPGGVAGKVVGASSPSRARESGDVSGARVAKSVAEVGEKHLLHGIEGSRETSQEPVA